MGVRLGNFQLVRPAYRVEQKESLDWIAGIHARSSEKDPETIRKLFHRVGCGTSAIQERGIVLSEYQLDPSVDGLEIYDVRLEPKGADTGKRSQVFQKHAQAAVNELFPEESSAPDDLIHVSCTGYLSPSVAQILVENRKWNSTTVTHCYHMGCYGAFPAVRMGSGFVHEVSQKAVDIVHTEICSLHINPAVSTAEQFVVESLFADGFIRYRLQSTPFEKRHFEIMAFREEIIPGSLDSMKWELGSHGMKMTLSRLVPEQIAAQLMPYLQRLCASAGLEWASLQKNALFAIHPGGPRIIDTLAMLLDISEPQIQFSRSVLGKYGNMSSATLPHVWDEILQSDAGAGQYVVSLAFGPGLTIAGNILRIS